MAQLRAILIAAHIVVVIVLSLPGPRQMLQRHVWDRPSNQRAFAALAEWFSWAGVESGEDFDQRLWAVAEGYVWVRERIAPPFYVYADLAGVRQGWAMFSRPRERPIELHVDIAEPTEYVPIYRPDSREFDFWARKLRQYRFRKITGRLARHYDDSWYDPYARFIASGAAAEYPDARRIRVQLYRYDTLPPAEVAGGAVPVGEYQNPRVFLGKDLR